MKIITLIIVAVLVGLQSGCASQNTSFRYAACSGKSFNQLLEATELKPLFNDMARELCPDLCGSVHEPAGKSSVQAVCLSGGDRGAQSVLVTDFADIQTFAPGQQGILMGELMRGGLSSVCGTKITQVEFAKYFNLNENGLVVLSRKVAEIKKDDYDQAEAIVGTYSYLNNKVLLFARRINVVTGKISRMVTREINYSCAGGVVTSIVK